jgi:glycosyltransferase involved in cell wall biosynthesis
VIPTYNRDDLVGQAVDSALAQTHPRCEIIVVDDGSTDRTQEVLARYEGRITAIRQENKGLAGARNSGIRAASGELVGFLDSDDLWEPRLVEEALKLFEAHPQVGAVFLAERDIDIAGRIDPKVHGKRTPGLFFTPEGMIGRDTGVGCGRPPIARRALLVTHGLFDETFRNFADCEMWIRHSFHFAMAILAEPYVLRRVHPGNVSADFAKDAKLWLRILDNVVRDHPEFAAAHDAVMRRTRGKQHLRIGRDLLARCGSDRGLAAEARPHLQASVRLWPRFYRAWPTSRGASSLPAPTAPFAISRCVAAPRGQRKGTATVFPEGKNGCCPLTRIPLCCEKGNRPLLELTSELRVDDLGGAG